MGSCWNCKVDVFLKEEETRCDRCGEILRYWCNNCAQPFDVENRKGKKKPECKWCFYFNCPNCSICSQNCPKLKYKLKIQKILNGIIKIDSWDQLNNKIDKIIEYFEEIGFGKEQKNCEFGVPKTYAKTRIKSILGRMKGHRVRNISDQKAFEERQEEILDKEIGYEFTITGVREDGSYGQEYRDVFNLCVCLGKLKHEKKILIKNGKEIGEYDSWIRIEESECPFLDTKKLIVKSCPKCKRIYERHMKDCSECTYPRGGKKHKQGESFKLIDKLSNNPTCTNLENFKKEDKKSGESKYKGNN